MPSKYLPLGSIVKLKNSDKKLMIIGYYSLEYNNSVKIYDYEGDSVLFFKFTHEFNLMFMDVLNWKCIRCTFFCIKTDGNPLHCTDIIYCTDFIKICQCDMTVLLINFNGSNRCGNFLYQRQITLRIFFIGPVNKLL